MDAARAAGMVKPMVKARKAVNVHNNKPWFNKECVNKRKAFFEAKCCYKLDKSLCNLNSMKKCSKEYKTCLSQAKCAYQNDLCKRVRDLRTSDPKQYWKVLNESINPKRMDQSSAVPYNDWVDHFRCLTFEEQTEPTMLPPHFQPSYNWDCLNDPFTEQEVMCSIKTSRVTPKKLHLTWQCSISNLVYRPTDRQTDRQTDRLTF